MLVDIYYLGFSLEGGSLATTVSLIFRKERFEDVRFEGITDRRDGKEMLFSALLPKQSDAFMESLQVVCSDYNNNNECFFQSS